MSIRSARKTSLPLLAGILLVVGLAVTSCAKDQPGPYVGFHYPGGLEDTETLVLLDKSLQSLISIDGQRASYTPDGRLKAEVRFRNLSSQPLTVQLQTVFKDEEGMECGDTTAWQTVLMESHAAEIYSANALNSNSVRYTVRVRPR